MASTTSKGGPLQTVKAFLACVKTKDVQHMREFAHPDATACLIGEGEPRFMALDEAIERLAKAEGQLVEEIWDEVEHRDGDYATVWSTFSIHGDGQVGVPRMWSVWIY